MSSRPSSTAPSAPPRRRSTSPSRRSPSRSVGAVRELRAGTAEFGTFGTARTYLGSDLVEDFRRSHPDVRVRIVGQNSSETVEAIRDGELEAGLVVLPVDDRGLEIRPAMRDEVLYVFAQRAGVTIEPQIDVEDVEVALELAARGMGDTIAPAGMLRRLAPSELGWVPFADPIYETFAFTWRRGAQLSPATKAFMTFAERRLDTLAEILRTEPPRRRVPPTA